MEISEAAIDLIIAWEVGGGDRDLARAQYDSIYARPTWPGTSSSGLTIGIGYDLRFAKNWFEGDWKSRLERVPVRDAYKRLEGYVGQRGSRAAVVATRDIVIPWQDAMAVFRVRRLPGFIADALRTFPNADMHEHVWGALTSLVYNCGTGTEGKPEKQHAYESIRAALAQRDVQKIAAGIREMKKHHAHSPKTQKGLSRRRDAEAELVLKAWSVETGAVRRG